MYGKAGSYSMQYDINNIRKGSYYTFTPAQISKKELQLMDDELMLLLLDAHHELGILEGLFYAIPDSEMILKRLLLREVCFSLQIDNKDISLYEIIAKNLVDRFTLNQIRVLAQMPKGKVDFQMLHSIGKGLYQGTEKECNGAFRTTQVFLGAAVIMNMQRYNPTAPAEIQDAMQDLVDYVNSDKMEDALIKVALTHYQFETIHPFSYGNGLIGRTLMQAMLKSCSMHYDCFFPLSEYLYYNKTEYFDKLSYVQNTGDYLPWIKFFVKGIGVACNQAISMIERTNSVVCKDIARVESLGVSQKQLVDVYLYFKRELISGVKPVAEKLEISYNTASKLIEMLIEIGILQKMNSQARHRLFGYVKLLDGFEIKFDAEMTKSSGGTHEKNCYI